MAQSHIEGRNGMNETSQTPVEFNQCQQAVQRLNEYLSRELNPDEAELVQEHLQQCKGCFDKFHFEETLLKTLREKVSSVKSPAGLRESVLRLIGRDAAP
jgi:anti-sigma factor (TIGR02949 family)